MTQNTPREGNLGQQWARLSRLIPGGSASEDRGWYLVPVALLTIVGLFLVPLPPSVLDLLLVANIVVSLALLLRAVLVREAGQLYAFPVLLLLTTIFRLSLNITSTRLILLRGEQGIDVAGHVIESFGKFVVGGDFVVGAIVFLMIATVNFLVITRGAARVAEVAARFSLDSLPGRQLAVDTDLRNGIISSAEAARARGELMRESQFYGSMDGAMRFVQGDAVATLVIVFINVIGGVFLGVYRGLSFSDALRNFGVLAVGDGLVSILPALLISLSAGLVVTHVAGKNTVGELVSRLFADRRTLLLPAGLLVVVGLIPGFPAIPFFAISALFVFLASRAGRTSLHLESLLREFAGELTPRRRASLAESLTSVISSHSAAQDASVSPLEILIGVGSPRIFFLGAASGTIVSEYEAEQERIYRERGIRLPEVRIRLARDLQPGEYRIDVRSTPARSGRISPEKIFVGLSPSVLQGFAARDVERSPHPLHAGTGCWIVSESSVEEGLREIEADLLPPHRFIALEAAGAALSMVEELFGVDELKLQIGKVRDQYPGVVAEVLDRGIISIPELLSVLHRLVRERVSIRDLKLIFEGIILEASRPSDSKDRQEFLDRLSISLRHTLARQIISSVLLPGGNLRVFALAPEVEDEFRSAISMWDGNPHPPPLEPELGRGLRQSAARMFLPVVERGALPVVLLVPEEIREGVSSFFRNHEFGTDWFVALSFEECGVRFPAETVGILGM